LLFRKWFGFNQFRKLLRSVRNGTILCNWNDLRGLWQVSKTGKKSGWFWPLGLLATSLAGVGVVVMRGCWHSKMSWPVRAQDHSYQVCLGCGIKRLFNEKDFRGYGPYSYDLNRLIAWDSARRGASMAKAKTEPEPTRNAS